MAEQSLEIRQVIEKFGDRATLSEAWFGLQKFGRSALEEVRDGLSHPNWRIRQWCAVFIDNHWDEAALQRLILTLTDPKLKVRKAAVHSLGCDRCKAGENPIDVFPYVEERLRGDKSIKVRRTAAWTLASQTPNKRIARALRRVLRDETDAKIRKAATWGIKRYEDLRDSSSPVEASH